VTYEERLAGYVKQHVLRKHRTSLGITAAQRRRLAKKYRRWLSRQEETPGLERGQSGGSQPQRRGL
jgi:hypothetical protein